MKAPPDTLTEQELADRNAAQPNPEAAFTAGAPTANEILSVQEANAIAGGPVQAGDIVQVGDEFLPVAGQSEPAPFDVEQMTADTMLGDLVRLILDEIIALPDLWQKLAEYKQDDVIRRVTTQSTLLVQRMVSLIAADGRDVIAADLEQITAKDGIKATLTLPKSSEMRHKLLDAVGHPVLIVVAGSSQFLGGAIPKPTPQQPSLPVDTPAADDKPVADNGAATAVHA